MIDMDDIVIDFEKKPKLKNAIFVEGLPGVGNVGKLAAEHLIDEIGAEQFAEILSIYFPPQVLVGDDGIATLVNNKLYFKKKVGEEGRDIVILTGDYQGMTPQGQYQLSDRILSLMDDLNVSIIFSLGGYGIGKMIDEPRVLGAATSGDLVSDMEERGVVFDEEHPSSGIVGASGLLLGLGKKVYGMDGVCLMGETSGYFVDPVSSRAVLKILTEYIGTDISYEELDEKAEEVESLTNKVMELDLSGGMGESKSEDLSYIG